MTTIRYLPILAIALMSNLTLAQSYDPPTLPVFDTTKTELFARQLMDYAEQFDSGWTDEVLQGEMTLVDAAGRSITRSFVRLSFERPDEGDKLLTRFTAPNDIRGVAALTFENSGASDDNWLYLPATKRARRIAGANNTSSFQGTEFTYEDLSSLDPDEYTFEYVGDETITIDGKETTTRVIKGVPTYEDTGYARLKVYLEPTTWAHARIDYYDLAGVLLKTRSSTGWETFHDRYWRPNRIEMMNHQSGKRTVLDIRAQYLDLSRYEDPRTGEPRKGLTEAQFTTRALVK